MATKDYVTGPPVGLLSQRLPFDAPQQLGQGQPHNLPPPIARPGMRTFQPVAEPGLPAPLGPLGPSTPIDDKYRYAEFNGEQVIAVGAADVLVLVEPPQRRNLLMFRNSGGTNLFLAFGAVATSNSVTRLASNQMVLFDSVVPQDEVHCISDAAGGQLTIAVSNYTPGG